MATGLTSFNADVLNLALTTGISSAVSERISQYLEAEKFNILRTGKIANGVVCRGRGGMMKPSTRHRRESLGKRPRVRVKLTGAES